VAPTTKPIPDAYRRVTPCLIVQGGAKTLELTANPAEQAVLQQRIAWT
jgi:hypothetical protein